MPSRLISIFSAAMLLLAGARPAPAVEPASSAKPASDLVVFSDFPGGSGKVLELDQSRRLIRLEPTTHKDKGWVCWWYVKVSGITPGETISLDVGNAPWATPDRAAFSTDNVNWTQIEPGVRSGQRIIYSHKVEAPVAWFAWGPPFVPADAEQVVKWAAEKCPHATAIELCKTRQGRSVPALRVKQPGVPDDQRLGIWINARQHAWESGGSWVCRGLLEWIISDDERAESLRKKSLITIVPIMDIDSVAIGAGGKQEKPQDHNRDWSDHPHWPSVAAAQAAIKELDAAGRFDMFLDLHNPGAGTKNPFFYISPRNKLSPLGLANLDRFLAAARLEMTGPLAYIGQTQESGPNYDPMWMNISKNWVTFHTREHVVAVTLETAWNTPDSTAEGYRHVGQGLGLAVERYFRTSHRGETAGN